MTVHRPTCRSAGVFVAYPCSHWPTPAQDVAVKAEAQALNQQ